MSAMTYALSIVIIAAVVLGGGLWAAMVIRNWLWRRRSAKRRVKYRPDGATLGKPHHSADRPDYFARRLRDHRW